MSKKILTVTLNPAIDYTIEVPRFSLDAVNRASSGRRDPGGKGVNVATALSSGGFHVGVTGFLGSDNSAIFQNHFRFHGLKDYFSYVDGSTREGIKIADPENEITTDINFPGFSIDNNKLNAFIEQYIKLVSSCDYVVLSGSLPVGLPPDIYGLLAKEAKKAGVFVAVDTSGEPLKHVIDSQAADLIKPNIDELSQVYDDIRNADDKIAAVDELAVKLLGKVKMIALSLGEEGSRLYTKDSVLEASAPKIKVKSTVGAGDTFLAGFVGGLASRLDRAGVLRNAASWAASKLTMYGPGLSADQPPETFFHEIKVREPNRLY